MADSSHISFSETFNAPMRAPAAYVAPEDAGARYYTDPAFTRAPNYRGPLVDKTDDQCLGMLRQIFSYLDIHHSTMPTVPPYGLTGRRWRQPSNDEIELVGIGYGLMLDMVDARPGREISAWEEARDFIRNIQRKAVSDYIARQLSEEHQRREISHKGSRVYFIASADGPIKIGKANNVQNRIKTLQTSHPHRLTLLTTIPGGIETERAYHARFAEHRLAGEWFTRHPDILAEVERINAQQVAA